MPNGNNQIPEGESLVVENQESHGELDQQSESTQKKVEEIVLDEEKTKQASDIIRFLKKGKNKEVKNILSSLNPGEVKDILMSRISDIEEEIDKSFSKNGDVFFYHIYNMFSPYLNLDEIIKKHQEALIQIYIKSVSSKQTSRSKLLNQTFGNIVDLENIDEDANIVAPENEKQLRELVSESRLGQRRGELTRLVTLMGGMNKCDSIILSEVKLLLKKGRYEDASRNLTFLSNCYGEFFGSKKYSNDLKNKILSEYCNELLTSQSQFSITTFISLYMVFENQDLFLAIVKKLETLKYNDDLYPVINDFFSLYHSRENKDLIFHAVETSKIGELFNVFLRANLRKEGEILLKHDMEKLLDECKELGIKQEDIGVHKQILDKKHSYEEFSLHDETLIVYNLLSNRDVILKSLEFTSFNNIFDKIEDFLREIQFYENSFVLYVFDTYIFNDQESKDALYSQIARILEKVGSVDTEEEEDIVPKLEDELESVIKLFGYENVEKFLQDKIEEFPSSVNNTLMHYFIKQGFHSNNFLTVLEKVKNMGREQVLEYVNDLVEKYGQCMLSSQDYSQELSQLNEDDYLILNFYIFKAGNYSSHNKNLKSNSNQLLHLSKYSFDADGYPVVLNGLKGYYLKEGEEENIDLLSHYVERVESIHVMNNQGRLNDKDFDNLLDSHFKNVSIEEFKELKDLSREEKIICLLIDEIVSDQSLETINKDVLDLILIYRYTFLNHLGDYVDGTRDMVDGENDSVSKNRVLWNELSNLYGEDIKDTVRHNIFDEGQKGDNFNEIISIYLKHIGEEDTQESFKPKQVARIKSTLENDKIPSDKKFEVIEKQILTILWSGIQLDSESKNDLKDEVEIILSEMGEKFDWEHFEKIMPVLINIKLKYKNKLDKKLGTIFAQDINAILAEVKKYREIIEQEDKTVDMSGGTNGVVKKKTKSRSIKGYFTKTKETSNARMGSFICIAGDTSMWENENYFELVLQNVDTQQCEGLVMLLNIETQDGKKYLWFGPNPNQSFLEKVSSEKCYKYLYKTVTDFAKENGYDGVVVPSGENSIIGECTNRGGDFPNYIKNSRLKDKKGNIKIVDFGEEHFLSSQYRYTDGALIWEK